MESLTDHEKLELKLALDDSRNRIEDGEYGDIGVEANEETLERINDKLVNSTDKIED